MHLFDRLGERWELDCTEADRLSGHTLVPDGWGRGRATWGGLVLALAEALVARMETERTLRTVQSQLVAPVVPGPLRGEVVCLRRGRTTEVLACDLIQAGRLVARNLFTRVQLQADATGVEGPSAPCWAPPEQVEPRPFVEGSSPIFTRRVDIRPVEGTLPYTGGDQAAIGGYLALPGAGASPGATLALLDAFWPPTLSLLDRVVPASTATWTAHLLAPPEAGTHRSRSRTVVARGGFSTQETLLWGPSGTLVGWAEQTTVVFG